MYGNKVSSLDLEKVALLCIFDQAHVETSARRQVSADVIKPSAGKRFGVSVLYLLKIYILHTFWCNPEVELEQPLNMIGLLALAGPGAVIAHAWSTPLVRLHL